jgi:hypothetical protein
MRPVKRLWRILLGLSMVLLLIACAGVLALWVRSYFVQDYLETRENYRGPSPVPAKFEFRQYHSAWDSTHGRVRFSSLDHLVGTNTQQEADRARWKPTRNVTRSRITPQHAENYNWLRTGPEGFWNRLGFFWWSRNDGAGKTKLLVLGTPYWAPALALALPPAAWLALAVRRLRRKRRPGACRVCGYDLRASPDRCPECGAPSTTTTAEAPLAR